MKAAIAARFIRGGIMRALIAGVVLMAITAAAAPAAAQTGPVQGRRPEAAARVGAGVRPRARLAARPRLRAALGRLDANHDRQISRDEFPGRTARFDRLDRNHDGVLNRDDRRKKN